MKRDELKELGVEKIDEVMAIYGKSVNTYKEEIDTLKTELDTLKTSVEETTEETTEKDKQIKDLETKINLFNETQKELEDLKTSIAEQEQAKKEAEQNEKFESDLNAILGDRKFINDYTRQALVNELKTELEGKEDAKLDDVFNELTKDREDLFSNPNPVEIPPTKEVEQQEDKTNIPIMW